MDANETSAAIIDEDDMMLAPESDDVVTDVDGVPELDEPVAVEVDLGVATGVAGV